MKTGTKIQNLVVSGPLSEMTYEEVQYDGTKEEFLKDLECEEHPFITVYGELYDGNHRMELHIRKSEIKGYGIEMIDVDAKDIIAPASYFLPEEEEDEGEDEEEEIDDEPLRTADDYDFDDDTEDDYREYITDQLALAFSPKEVTRSVVDIVLTAQQEVASRIEDYCDEKGEDCMYAFGDSPNYVAIDSIIDMMFLYHLATEASLAETMQTFKQKDLIEVSWKAFLKATEYEEGLKFDKDSDSD